MPTLKNKDARDSYAYAYSANGNVFYVGFGHEGCATERCHHVTQLMKRDVDGTKPEWSLNEKVILTLRERGEDVWIHYPMEAKTQSETRAFAEQLKKDLLHHDCVLANVKGNSTPHTVDEIVSYVLSHKSSACSVGGRRDKLECAMDFMSCVREWRNWQTRRS